MKTNHLFVSRKAAFGSLKLILAIMILIIVITGLHAQRTLPTLDQFDYATGPLQGVGLDWTRISGSANDLVVTDGNITYNGYLGIKGRKCTMTNGAADDLKLSFTSQNVAGTTLFVSFVMSVLNTTGLSSSGTYCFILGSGTANFAGRIFIKISGSGYALGVSKTATAPVAWSSALSVSTTHLVVLSYEIKSGTSNDVVSLWIDPPITTIQPAAGFSTSAGSDFGGGSSIDGFMLRQATGTPNASLDDIGISTAWSDLFKNPVYTASGSIGAGSFNDLTVKGSTATLTMAGNISISGILSLGDANIFPSGNTLSYGSNGILTYSGLAPQTTTANEFPSSNGPKELIIDNPAGVTLILNRTLSGNMTIKAGSMLSILPLKSLTVQGTTTLSSIESLIIKSDATGTGSFIDNGIINGTGTAKVERYLTGYSDIHDLKYHFISSPVGSQAIQPGFVANPPDAEDDFYKWDEPSAMWINSKNNSGSWNTVFETGFIPGKGYLVSYPSDLTKDFTGMLNTNPPTSPLTVNCTWTDPSSGGGGGWNLLGNPYPSAIDWDLVTRGSGIDNALYYYDASIENYRYYLQYQPGVAVGNGSQFIPSMQGFMVHANNQGTASVLFDNTCRVHEAMSTFYKNTAAIKNVLKLKVEKEGRYDEMIVCLMEESGFNFDCSSDAYKLYSFNPAVPQIYSITPDQTELAVNTLPGNEGDLVVPVGFKPGTNGSFTMTANETNSFPYGTSIIIEDLKTGIIHNLVKDPVYLFSADLTDYPERFLLHFSGINGINNEKETRKIRIYSTHQNICILPDENFQKGTIALFSPSGQELLRRDLSGSGFVSIHLDVNPGLYLVKVLSERNVQVEKVFIQ